MNHYALIHRNGTKVVHLDSPINGGGDTALCGHDLIGDGDLGWETLDKTSQKVNCQNCIKIVRFCKLVQNS